MSEPYYGLFYYSYFPCTIRNYDFFEDPFDLLSYISFQEFFRNEYDVNTKATQTPPCPALLIGDKIIKEYGENYTILLEQ